MIKNKDGSFTIEAGDSLDSNKTCRICDKSLIDTSKSFKCQVDDEGEMSGVHVECLENENE